MIALIGGQPYSSQTQSLQRGAHLLVGTPGRTLDLLRNRYINVEYLRTVVLDEADRMLDEGFAEEVKTILESLPSERQTIFFSATLSENVEKLSSVFQKNAQKITVDKKSEEPPAIEQYAYSSENSDKITTLIRIMKSHPSMCTLIFCRTKATVDEVGIMLTQSRVSSGVLHGDLEQMERDRMAALFRNGSLRVLVATDIAARGLDIESLELVINLDLPSSPEVYVHRIGRTGRAGRKGTAASVFTAYEETKILEIEKVTGKVMIRQNLEAKNTLSFGPEFQKATMKTIQISGGRLDKVRAGDILGALTSEPQPVAAVHIGKIDIFDRFSYVAIKSDKSEQALTKLRTSKTKGKKLKAYFI